MDQEDPQPEVSLAEYTALKEELLKLQEWKEEVGMPSQLKLEELQHAIEGQTIEIDSLRTEVCSLKLEVDTYSTEVDKLKQEKDDLSEEISALHTEQQQYQLNNDEQVFSFNNDELEQLKKEKDKSHAQLVSERELLAQIKAENERLQAQNKQYEIELEDLERRNTELIRKSDNDDITLSGLQDKYETLETENLHNTDLVKKTSYMNQHLQTKLTDIEDINEASKRPTTMIDPFSDSTNQNLGGGHAAGKTLRLGLHTLRLGMADSGLVGDEDYSVAQLYDNDTFRAAPSPRFNVDDTPMQSNAFSDDENFPTLWRQTTVEHGAQGDDEKWEEKTHEFEEKWKAKLDAELQQEKEQHRTEIEQLQKEMEAAKKKVEKYKKKLSGRDEQIEKLKSSMETHGQITPRRSPDFNRYPNNELDKSKCKVFGWSVF